MIRAGYISSIYNFLIAPMDPEISLIEEKIPAEFPHGIHAQFPHSIHADIQGEIRACVFHAVALGVITAMSTLL